ncbi:hypothetical protein EJB05_52272, partial [Eragrostis curvula]
MMALLLLLLCISAPPRHASAPPPPQPPRRWILSSSRTEHSGIPSIPLGNSVHPDHFWSSHATASLDTGVGGGQGARSCGGGGDGRSEGDESVYALGRAGSGGGGGNGPREPTRAFWRQEDGNRKGGRAGDEMTSGRWRRDEGAADAPYVLVAMRKKKEENKRIGAANMETYTIDDALTVMGFGKFQAFILVYAGMGWVVEAMQLMLLSFLGSLVQEEWKISAQDVSFSQVLCLLAC